MADQTSLPIKVDNAGSRIRCRVIHSNNHHTKIQLWLNGDLITGDHSLIVRNRDVNYLVVKLKPDVIIVDRENVSDDLWKRIKHTPGLELI